MLPICQVCLRTDRKLQTLEDSLSNWHDELCDFAIEDFVQFCSECSYLLKKCQDFKAKCIRATKILKNWKKQKADVRKPLHQLKDQIPSSSLGLCNRKNQRVYYYQAPELDASPTTPNSSFPIDTLAPIQTFNPTLPIDTSEIETHYSKCLDSLTPTQAKNPHIITVNMTINDNVNTSNLQLLEYDINYIKEGDVKLEDEFQQNENTDIDLRETIVFEELQVKNDIDSDRDDNASDNSDDESSDIDIKQLLNDTALNSDSSEDEIIKLKKPKKRLSKAIYEDTYDKPVKKAKRIRHKKPFNIELLKNMLSSKFASSGEVKDEEGNLIDKECILNSLDKMHIYTLNQIRNRCTGTTVFSAEALKVLSRVQKKYGNQYSSVFSIEHLPTKDQVMAEFEKRQHYEGYVTSEHKCTLCYRGFKHKKLLDYHVNMYHDPAQPHFCSICQMRFKTRHALLKHRNGHRAVYKCKLCPLVTNYRTAMVNHYHQHKGMVYTCELCKGTFKSKSCLSAHMNYMHQSQHICSLCARTFASESGLSQHRLRKHQNEVMAEGADNRKCDQCNVTFVSDEVFQKHLEKSHAEKKNNVYVYKKRNYVAPRQKPNFVCRVCKVVEHSIGRLTWHFKREHPTENYELVYSDVHKHLCHVCGKGYASITDLNEHKHLHTGAKPYACDKCPKAFHRKINLRNHLERHLPPARECQQCGKKFVSAANLNNHIKMHIGVRHHSCEICAKSFLHRSALNAHVRGVHHHIRRARKPTKSGAE